jgi:hypothetical protein
MSNQEVAGFFGRGDSSNRTVRLPCATKQKKARHLGRARLFDFARVRTYSSKQPSQHRPWSLTASAKPLSGRCHEPRQAATAQWIGSSFERELQPLGELRELTRG